MSVAKQGVQGVPGVPRMGHPQGYRNLVAWRVLDELADLVHAATAHFPPAERKLVEQMNSAATSVVANIAEGYGRRSLNEYLHFLASPEDHWLSWASTSGGRNRGACSARPNTAPWTVLKDEALTCWIA